MLHVTFLALSLYPLLSVHVLPLSDYPNHLARNFIAYNIDRIPDIQQVYAVHWQVSPYMAIDAMLYLFQHVMDIYMAGKCFVVMAFLSVVAGVLALNTRLYKTPSHVTLLVYPCLYSMPLLWGFINFIFGIGIALLSFTLWLTWRRRFTFWRGVLFFTLLMVNFFSHAVSYGILGLTILLYETFHHKPYRHRDGWREYAEALTLLALFALPQALLWLYVPKTLVSLGTHMGGVIDMFNTVMSPIWFTYTCNELVLFCVMVLGLRFTLVRTEKALVYTILALVIISLCVPLRTFGVYLTNIRIPLFAMLLAIAVSQIDIAAMVRRKWIYAASLCAALIVVCSVWRYVEIQRDVKVCGEKMEEFREAMHRLPVHTVPLFTVINYHALICPLSLASNHLNSLAAIEAHAFVPEIFTVMPPVKPAEALKDIDVPVGDVTNANAFFTTDITSNDWRNKATRFRYIAVIDAAQKHYKIPAAWHLIQQGSFFRIYDNKAFKGTYVQKGKIP